MSGHQSGGPASRDTTLGATLLIGWALWATSVHMGGWAPDLSALYMAGRFYAQGAVEQVYAAPPRFFGDDIPAAWRDELAALGHADAATFPFVYPPLWAALAAPVAGRVGPVAFFAGAYAVQIAMLAGAVVLAWRLVRPRLSFTSWAALGVGLLLTSVIAAHALMHNQPQITVAFLTLLAFERLAAGRQTAAGAALGLAAALKLSPVLLVLVFAAERRWRAVLVTLAVAGGLALASLAVAGPALHAEFLGQIRRVADQLVIGNFNLSLGAAAYQIAELAAGRPLPDTGGPVKLLVAAPGWLAPAMAGVLAGGAALVWAATRALPPRDRLIRRAFAGLLLITLTGPLSWVHHYLAVLFLLPALPSLRPGAAGWVFFLGYALLFSSALYPRLPGYTMGLDAASLIATGAMVGLVVLVLLPPRRGAG